MPEHPCDRLVVADWWHTIPRKLAYEPNNLAIINPIESKTCSSFDLSASRRAHSPPPLDALHSNAYYSWKTWLPLCAVTESMALIPTILDEKDLKTQRQHGSLSEEFGKHDPQGLGCLDIKWPECDAWSQKKMRPPMQCLHPTVMRFVLDDTTHW